MTSKEVFKILCQLGYKVEILNVDPSTFEKEITKYSFDCCFNALHGTFGEDGQIQKILFNHLSKKANKYISKEVLNTCTKERAIADFIAGMTDRYAINLYNNIK